MYYTIETRVGWWVVRFGGRTIQAFRTHAEARAYLDGRRSLASAVNPESVKAWYEQVKEGMGRDW